MEYVIDWIDGLEEIEGYLNSIAIDYSGYIIEAMCKEADYFAENNDPFDIFDIEGYIEQAVNSGLVDMDNFSLRTAVDCGIREYFITIAKYNLNEIGKKHIVEYIKDNREEFDIGGDILDIVDYVDDHMSFDVDYNWTFDELIEEFKKVC